MVSAKANNLVGQTLANRYRILEPLGSGTMGSVFRAEHVHMKKTVAVKVLHATHTKDPEVVERFQREAQAAANIEHPNICAATDFGIQDDTYFLVMEFINGRPLHDALKEEESFSELKTIHIAKQICAGLERAHEMGVVHRDLKPENILLVEKDGDPDFIKITDFGVAQVRLFKDAARLTQAGVVYGSPLYMSPEQAGGREVDHRADLYSVGIMLYEMLTGKMPFYAKSLTVVLNMHLQDPPPPFRIANPMKPIDLELEEITMRLLAKRREERFQSASDLYDALARVEKRLLDANKPKKPVSQGNLGRGVLTAVALIVSAVLVVWAAWTFIDVGRFKGQPTPSVDASEALVGERKGLIASNDLKTIETRIHEDVSAGLQDLDDWAMQNGDNAHAMFLHGQMNAIHGRWTPAFQSFKEAIQLDPRYRNDRELLDQVMRRFEATKDDEALEAQVFLKEHIQEAGLSRLAAIAEHHRLKKIRIRALLHLQETGLFDKLEEWNQLTIQLRHAVECEENRQYIVRIGELGDTRALAALQRFNAMPRDRCEGKDCWECLREDLRNSIARLKGEDGGT